MNRTLAARHPSALVYGPVHSRRLGYSLGLNIIPHKTCTLDCIYCQCGRTTCKTLKREPFCSAAAVADAVRAAVRVAPRIDYLTFSGEGEPTLNSRIGTIIRRLKREFRIPVAVLTNSTLIADPKVRRDLMAADLVVPSLDAADQRVFQRADRCHRDLKVADIIDGLIKFRRRFRGRIWLEIMLCKDINDSPEHLVQLRHAVAAIRPDVVHLNTVARPPAETFALPLTHDDLVQIQYLFGPDTEIAEVAEPGSRPRPGQAREPRTVTARIIALCRGRPVTSLDIAESLGILPARLDSLLAGLLRSGAISRRRFRGTVYYRTS